MKTKYKFIDFTKVKDLWVIRNIKSGVPIAALEYYAPWRQWVLSAVNPGSVFSADCLTDIADFLVQLKSTEQAEEAA
jgi:hypothetical protein